MPVVRPRSTFGRAVLPVVGGALVIAAIFGCTWAVAAWIGDDSTERLTPSALPVGRVESVSEDIAESGPQLYPGLNTDTGERTLVLDHGGIDPTRGWRVYEAYPADRDPSCRVDQVEGTARFVDCDGREIDVGDLAPSPDTCPIVEQREQLSIGLRPEVCGRAGD